MFGPLGFQELLLILVIALLIFGPKKLPEIGRTIGKGMAEFRRATSDLKRSIETEVDLDDRKPSLASASSPAGSPAGSSAGSPAGSSAGSPAGSSAGSSASSSASRDSKSEESKDD